MYFIGLDIGTQSVRVLITDESGGIIANVSVTIEDSLNLKIGNNIFEQKPLIWWDCTKKALKKSINTFIKKDLEINNIKSICIDGTSGTIIPIDNKNEPLMNAIMYKDGRSYIQAEKINDVAVEITEKLGYKFNSSFALNKILWVLENKPEIYKKTKFFLHQTDFIVGKLTGIYNVSDHSNSFKTGFDLINYKWPDYIENKLAIDINKLPKVIKPGEIIANIKKDIAKEFGLNENLLVVAGMTDSNAALFASGASGIGDFNSVIGTTLALKGITKDLVKDKFGIIYCHLHPEGYWLPGGASSTGGECLEVRFPKHNFAILDNKIKNLGISEIIIYPLIGTGERFPFYNNQAKGFIIRTPKNKFHLYKAYLEGVGYLEKLCFESLSKLGIDTKDKIYITGGGAKSDVWSQIRSNILGKVLLKPKIEETVMGAAITAASKTYFNNITEATKSMVKIEKQFYPDLKITDKYSEYYQSFKKELRKRNYI